ncbi:unnamed protein product [Brugia timori]|uniref:DUF4806 domain-containing protein n=1 Tax=Brugia timori TaxID=42155 RepID=A0A0R3QGG8_9BILA|nr:unnamed protein product [Brugia timori]
MSGKLRSHFKFRQLLLTKKPESCAQLITTEDYRLLRLGKNLRAPIKEAAKFEQLNGLLLILLPHGENVRNDLLERLIDSFEHFHIISGIRRILHSFLCYVYLFILITICIILSL